MSNLRPINTLHNWDKNPRGVKKDDFERLKRLITKLGVFKPFVITEDGTVLGGNMRLRACMDLGIEEVPVVVVDAPDEKTKIEYALADNDRVGYYEDQALAELLMDIDINLEDYKVDIGEPRSLKDLLSQFGPDIEEDEAPDVEDGEPDSKYGEVYQLGRHRLMCGDATKIEDVEKLMDGQKADMSFTSPPYNVGHNLGYEGKDSKYINSNDNLDDYVGLIVKSTKLSLNHANEVFVNIQFLANNKKDILLWLAELSDSFKDIFFWKKLQVAPQMAHNVANNQTEIIVLFGHNNNRVWGNQQWKGNFSNSIETNSASGENKNSKIHNATFPVALPAKFIQQGYKELSIVLDLFGGSGSTLIACEQTNRICYMMELDPKYVDVIRKRYAKFIGKEDLWQETTPKI